MHASRGCLSNFKQGSSKRKDTNSSEIRKLNPVLDLIFPLEHQNSRQVTVRAAKYLHITKSMDIKLLSQQNY